MKTLMDLIEEEIRSYKETEWKGMFAGVETVFRARPLNGADMTMINRAHPEFMLKPTTSGMLDLIILKARKLDGSKAFDKGNKPVLERLTTNVIIEIFSALFGSQLGEDDDEKFEDRVKN